MIAVELNPEYLAKLEAIAAQVQDSDALASYLEEEEDEYYTQLKETFEAQIAEVYQEIAANNPLQLIATELVLLDPVFEGLYLPRILCHAVLRGEINDHYKYVRPQEHFKAILLAICNSSNFDILKKRIGQTIQMGFALSSDIWVTSMINAIQNRKVRTYLQNQKADRFRNLKDRIDGYVRYTRQFRDDNYHTAFFPENRSELHSYFNKIKNFLLYRSHTEFENNSLIGPLNDFVSNKELQGMKEHVQIVNIYAAFFEKDEKSTDLIKGVLTKARKEMEEFDELILQFLLKLHHNPNVKLDGAADQRLSEVYEKSVKDDVSQYFELTDLIHQKGYTSTEVHEAIKETYHKHEGLSLFNENIRRTIYAYFANFISNIETDDYAEFFEISKLIAVYQELFGNQKFNQDIKDLSMTYVRRLLKVYTDKRGRDYQDIKKFVSSTFLDFGYLREKEIVELFKTRRKRKKVAE